jgi:uncharacterized protein
MQDQKWDSATALQRAHIIAHSLGGDSTPSNLVLLCAACHRDAPMTNDPAIMFRWIEKREVFWMRENRDLKLELERHGVDAGQFVKHTKTAQDEAFEQAIRELEPGLHWTGESVSKISIGTMTAVCVRVMEILDGVQAASVRTLFRESNLMGGLDPLVAILRTHEGELRKAGIRTLSLFGSVARGEQGPSSDVDISVQLDPEAHLGLFRFVALQSRLNELLGREVQLLPEPLESPRLQANLERDRRRVF